MYQLDFNVVKDSTELNGFVVSYERVSNICSGTSTLNVTFSNKVSETLEPGDTITLSENSIQVGIFYVSETEKSSKEGTITANCVDGSKWLQEYFIDEPLETTPGRKARYWLEQVVDLTGLTLSFFAANDGIDMDAVITLGLQSAYQAITTICQQNGWYFTIDSSGVLNVGSVDFAPSGFVTTFDDDDIIDVQIHRDDEMLRNRAVVWGSGDPEADDGWVYSDRSVNTAWNRDSNDVRTVAIANGAIGSKDIADAMAYQILNEFARITFEKTVTVHGFRDLNVGDGVKVANNLFTGVGMITTLRTMASQEGAITEVVLDQRCPRLFAYFRTWDFMPGYPYSPYYFGELVYAATRGGGVYTKIAAGGGWGAFNDGLGDLDVIDLYVANGVIVCVTANGSAYKRFAGDSSWRRIVPPQPFVDESKTDVSYALSEVEAVACAINQSSGEIYIAYNLKDGYRSWVLISSSEGNVYTTRQAYRQKDSETFYNVRITDLDTNQGQIYVVAELGSAAPMNSKFVGSLSSEDSKMFSANVSMFDGENSLEDVEQVARKVFQFSSTSSLGSGLWDNYYFVAGREGTQSELHRYNMLTEEEDVLSTSSVRGLIAVIGEDKAIMGVGTGGGTFSQIYDLYDFSADTITNSLTAVITTGPSEYAGRAGTAPYLDVSGNIRLSLFTFSSADGNFQYKFNSSTGVWTQVAGADSSTWDLRQNGLQFGRGFFPTNTGPMAVIPLAGLTNTATGEDQMAVIKVNKNDDSFTQSLLTIPNTPALTDDASTFPVVFDPENLRLYFTITFEDSSNNELDKRTYYVPQNDINTVVDVTGTVNQTRLDRISNGEGVNSAEYGTVNQTTGPGGAFHKVSDDSVLIDYSSLPSTTGRVLTIDSSGKVYKPKSAQSESLPLTGYTWGVEWKDLEGNSGEYVWRSATPFGAGSWHLIGNTLFKSVVESGDRFITIIYPDPNKDRVVLRTSPSEGFSVVFDIDEANNRDALIGVESSKESPIVLYGSESQVGNDSPDLSKGLMYQSDTGIADSFVYNVVNEFGYGIINDVRVFDIYGTTVIASGLTVDPTGGDFNRYILFTQPDGKLRYKHVDSNLSAGNVMGSFPGPVTHVETNNHSFAPHIFVSISGVPPRIFQRLNNQTTFSEVSAGLPNAAISQIRMDDFF